MSIRRTQRRRWWQDALIAGAGAAFALVGVGITASTGFASKNRELDIAMVNVSLSILRGDNDGTKSTRARSFALRTLAKYSGVDISAVDFESWLNDGTVPYKPVLFDSQIDCDTTKAGTLYQLFCNPAKEEKLPLKWTELAPSR